MATPNNRAGWTVMIGLLLIGMGIWFLLGGFFPAVGWFFSLIGKIGWPLLLVGLGLLLILRARGGGFNVNGKKLYRSRSNRMIGGVLGGFAEYMGVDATVMRVLYAFASLITGLWWGPLLYILAMIIVPEEPYPAGWVPAAAPTAPAPPAPPVPPAAASGFYAPEPPAAPQPPAAPAPAETPAEPAAAPAVPDAPVVPSDPMSPPEAPDVPPVTPAS